MEKFHFISKLDALLGRNRQISSVNGIISVEFITFLDKKAIFQKESKLKRTGIVIIDDVCPEYRQQKCRLKLFQIVAQEHSNDKRKLTERNTALESLNN